MDVMTAIKGRRSIRSFLSMGMEPGDVEALKESLIWAPSAGNLQSRRFYFVFNAEKRGRVAEAAFGQTFVAEAPLVVVACADMAISQEYGERGRELYAIEDVSCSIENMMLFAHSIGLGTVWVGAFDERAVSKALDIRQSLRPVAIVPVGYPTHVPPPTPRFRTREMVIEVV
jgi:nitroreductase